MRDREFHLAHVVLEHDVPFCSAMSVAEVDVVPLALQLTPIQHVLSDLVFEKWNIRICREYV